MIIGLRDEIAIKNNEREGEEGLTMMKLKTEEEVWWKGMGRTSMET